MLIMGPQHDSPNPFVLNVPGVLSALLYLARTVSAMALAILDTSSREKAPPSVMACAKVDVGHDELAKPG